MTMTKADIVERIYERVGFSKKEATEVVESIFELVKKRLEQGEKFLRGHRQAAGAQVQEEVDQHGRGGRRAQRLSFAAVRRATCIRCSL